MKIILIGKAVKADDPADICDILCAQLIGIIDESEDKEEAGNFEQLKPLVKCSSQEVWFIDVIEDVILLDDDDMPQIRGKEVWHSCCENMNDFGLNCYRKNDLDAVLKSGFHY